MGSFIDKFEHVFLIRRMAAIHEGAAIRKSEFYVCCGSGTDGHKTKTCSLRMAALV